MMSLTSKDKTGILIMIACVLSVSTLAGFGLAAARSTLPSDASTGCELAIPSQSHLVILIDRTDPLTSAQEDYVEKRVGQAADATKRGDRISVFQIGGEEGELIEPLFSRCSPRNPVHANPVYENTRRIKERFDGDFREPLLAAIREEVSDAVASSSPILESIQAVSELREFSAVVPGRKLVIVSDMLQNVSGYSHYEGADYQEFARTPYASSVTADLSKVEVEVVYLRRVRDRAYQTPSHTVFWKEYFASARAANPEIHKR